MIVYALGTSRQRLAFTGSVLAHMERHRQLRFWQGEAGGLLFAKLSPDLISVEHATRPRGTDRRTRSSYHPDRRAEQREIDELYGNGLFFVGTWHSHPEPVPTVSRVDLQSLTESFRLSAHHLNAFVLAIIGQRATPAGLTVMVGDAGTVTRLSPDGVGASLVEEESCPTHAFP